MQVCVELGAGALPKLSAVSRGATCVVEKLYETEGARPVSLEDGKLVVPVAGGEELTFKAAAERDAGRSLKTIVATDSAPVAPPPAKRARASKAP